MKDPVSMRNLYFGGAAVLIVGIIVILLVFSGAPQIEAKDPVYEKGMLKTVFTYGNEEPLDVWIQYEIFKEDGMFSSAKISPMQSVTATFKKGGTLSELPVKLDAGKYKIFIYILERKDSNKRITGFIKYADVI